MKYKVGDKVKVLSDLTDIRYGKYYATAPMVELRGTVVTITSVCIDRYHIHEQKNGNHWWTDEMFEGLAREPGEFKVGDRVKNVKGTWGDLKIGALGTVIVIDNSVGVQWDEECGGHNCGCGKHGYCWWMADDEIEFIGESGEVPTPEEPKPKFKVGDKIIGNEKADKRYGMTKTGWTGVVRDVFPDRFTAYGKGGRFRNLEYEYFDLYESKPEPKPEPMPEPTPEPTVNINVTVNLYENACWYCRKGGVVDIYLAGVMGICPSCGRVCNNHTRYTKSNVSAPKKPTPKKSGPLTTKELKALPDGTRVFTVDIKNGIERLESEYTCWRVKEGSILKRKHGHFTIKGNGSCYHAYLEMPEGAVDSGE